MKRLRVKVGVPNTRLNIKKLFAAEGSSLIFLPAILGTEYFTENRVVYLKDSVPGLALTLGNSI